MATYDDKTGGVDAVENASNTSDHNAPRGGDVDDQIIYDLQHHGEEVGFTFRSLMAAAVRLCGSLRKTSMLTRRTSLWACATMHISSHS